MLSINWYSHIPYLAVELKNFLPDGSFASRLWRDLGETLHHRLVEWPFPSEIEESILYPVESLYFWVTQDEGLDPEWLASEDGSYLDDDGEVIPSTLKPTYNATEQLAAYGLWLIEERFDNLGPIAEEGRNEYGWSRDDVIENRAACMLLAYQALSFAQRIVIGTPLSPEEIRKAAQMNFSAMGKSGANKRHAPMRELKDWVIIQYRAGQWTSANKAAHDLKNRAIDHGRTIGAHLSEENAQRTIAVWIRQSV